MERSVSVSSDRNILDHLWRWSTYFGRNIPTEIRRSIFDKPVLCPNRPFARPGHMVRNYIYWQEPIILVSKLHSGTSKTMRLPLFWNSHYATLSPVYCILYHVTGSCKGPVREFGRRIENDKSQFYWLAQFTRKMSFHFPQVFPLISDRSHACHRIHGNVK